ncbi:hypothetical protein D6C80_02332, partial [Aureobasidium pullulans]
HDNRDGYSNGTNTDIDGIGDIDHYRDNYSYSTCSHYHGSKNLYTYGDITIGTYIKLYIKFYTITHPHRSL